MVIIDNRRIAQMQRLLVEGKDVTGPRGVLEEILEIPHEYTRIGMLDYAATHCGIREIAISAFDLLCKELQSHPSDVKAGQVEDMYFSGTKIPEISERAISYTLDLIESGDLKLDLGPTRNFLEFVITKKEGKLRERAQRLLNPSRNRW